MLLFMSLAMVLAIPAVALADNLKNDLATTAGDIVNYTAGAPAVSVGYYIQSTGGTCDAADGSAATVTLSSNTSGVNISPAEGKTFTRCGEANKQSFSFATAANATPGDYVISANVLDSTGSYNSHPATFTLRVSAPAAPADTTAPVITKVVTGTLGNNGWYTSNVGVDWTVTDNESTISSQSGCDDFSVTNDQQATTYTCTATSAGGTNSEQVTIKRDATAPTIQGAASPAANGFGWNNSSVTVNYSCGDNLSGMASCGPNETLSSEGANQSSTGNATDNAGNSASDTVSGINIDKTNPLVSLVGGPANGSSHYFGSVPNAPTCDASDALSGLNGACQVSGYGTTVGSHTVKATANDKAGNTNSASNSYSVLAWTLDGFKSPVDMGIINNAKGGSTVPLKFEVFAGSTELTDTSIVKTFTQKISCAAGTGDDIEQYATGGTSLRYDSTGGQFIFNWQTPKAAGSCYKVTLETQDGSKISADFRLK